MNKYDKNSLKAEEFINDGEILDSLKFADENKNNLELVDRIIEKARLKKGINHREASVLLACEDKERIKEIYNLARQIKKDFYGDRIVMFAPLYLSNYCVNGCVYCPYHAKNMLPPVTLIFPLPRSSTPRTMPVSMRWSTPWWSCARASRPLRSAPLC